MKTYRKIKQTKFVKNGLEGLLTVHDHGKIAVSMEHKSIFKGLNYEEAKSYFYIDEPSTSEKTMIMDRLFDEV